MREHVILSETRLVCAVRDQKKSISRYESFHAIHLIPLVLQSYLIIILGGLEPGFLSNIMGMNISRMLHFSTGTFTRDLEGRERYDVRLIWWSH